MRLVLLGPPGAGKGTQATHLARRHHIPHISTGDLLRVKMQDGSQIGAQAKSYVEKGQLVPDQIVLGMVKERLARQDTHNGFILDGFPRTEGQAMALEHVLNELEVKLDWVLNFQTSEQVIIDRLSGRRVCPQCHANYHLRNIPPRRAGQCDRCDTALIQRKDDQIDTIRDRLAVYEHKTAPLIDFYTQQGILKDVSGDLDVEPLGQALEEFFKAAHRS